MPDGSQARSGERMAAAWARPGLPAGACRPRLHGGVPAGACRPRLVDENAQQRAWALCDVVTKEPLSLCGKVLNLDKWRNICLEKMCECRDEMVNGTKPAATDVDISAWRILLKCPAECPAPLVHYDCYRRRCEPACAAAGGGGAGPGGRDACGAAPGLCFPGCFCPAGTLRRGDRCVPPDQCADCECKGVGTPADYTTFDGDTLPLPRQLHLPRVA
ncbi:hypothetical protein ACJJTC_011686 [Scirpophaga incertulas]